MRIRLAAAAALLTLTALPLAAQHGTAKHRTPARRPAAAAASSGLSGAWAQLYADPTVSVSIDTTQTRSETNRTKTVRLKWDYANDQAIGRAQAYRTMVQREMIDCSTVSVKPVAAITYDASGHAVSSYTMTSKEMAAMDWAHRPAGTSAAKAYAAACARVR